MFTNLNEFSLWDISTKALKEFDTNTTQRTYEGELRGQSERFMITAGRLLVDLFSKIDEAFYYNDIATTSASNLHFLQRKIFAKYLDAELSAQNEKIVRAMLEEMIFAWKFKGTRKFSNWIIWIVFGWKLIDVLNTDSIFYLNTETSFTFDPDVDRYKLKRLLQPSYLGFGGAAILVIDVFNDPDFAAKSVTLQELMSYWFPPSTLAYVNND